MLKIDDDNTTRLLSELHAERGPHAALDKACALLSEGNLREAVRFTRIAAMLMGLSDEDSPVASERSQSILLQAESDLRP